MMAIYDFLCLQKLHNGKKETLESSKLSGAAFFTILGLGLVIFYHTRGIEDKSNEANK